jgi:hypothetical protein
MNLDWIKFFNYISMKVLLLALLIAVLILGCKIKDETYYFGGKIQNGIYMGYFEYQNKNYWCEIEFDGVKYIEWPSGGAMFQKSYGCLTVGNYSLLDDKLTFRFDSFKMPRYPEACIPDMLLPGEYKIYGTIKADSLIFEKGTTSNRIKYHLKKLQLD